MTGAAPGEVGADPAAEAADAVAGERPGATQEGAAVEADGEVAGVVGALPAAATKLLGAAENAGHGRALPQHRTVTGPSAPRRAERVKERRPGGGVR